MLVGLDWRVLLFTAALSIGTGILFGLLPALQSARTDLSTTLKDSTGRSGATLRHNKARSTLVVVEVALALLLLVGSALLIRTLVNLRDVQPGYDPTNVLTMRMSLTGQRVHEDRGGRAAAYATGLERLQALPGVQAAAATCCVPLEGGYGLPFRIIGRPLEKGPFHGGGAWLTVSPTTSMSSRSRSSAAADSPIATMLRAPGVVIINEAFAKQFFKDKDPPERAPDDRRWRHEGALAGTRAPDHRRGQRRSRRRAEQRAGPAHVRPERAGARRAQRVERPHHARCLGGAYARRTLRLEQRDSGAAARGQWSASLEHPVDGGSGLSLDLPAAVQRAADDGLRRLGAAARRDRHLRPDGVLGGAADAGDRHPHRARRRGTAGPPHGRRFRGCGWRSSASSSGWERPGV